MIGVNPGTWRSIKKAKKKCFEFVRYMVTINVIFLIKNYGDSKKVGKDVR
jgi:hypothetical protein